MTLMIILSFYYASRWIIYLLVILIASIALLLNKITGGYLFRYLKKVRSGETANFLLAIQWIFSVLPAPLKSKQQSGERHQTWQCYKLNYLE